MASCSRDGRSRWSPAVLALSAKDPSLELLLVGFLPALLFWGLDGYFLAQERLFRALYQDVVDPEIEVSSYSLAVPRCNIICWAKSTFSWTLAFFHGGLVVVLIASIRSVLHGA